MRIKKISQPTPIVPETAQITDTYSTSTNDGYSCNYVNELNTYSTSETETGQIWIDGNTIYRKVIQATGDSSNSQYMGAVSNIDNVVRLEAWVNNGTVIRNCYTCYYGNLNWASQVYLNNGSIVIECGSSFANFKNGSTIYIVIEYTKTTD